MAGRAGRRRVGGRRAEGAEGKAPGSSEPNDGKRSLATWHAPDSYAFGVVLWEVCTLRRPWAGVVAAHQIWLRVEKGERPPVTDADVDGAPEGYLALMRELWHQDPVARPTFAEARRRLEAMRATAPAAAAAGNRGS